MKPMHEIINMNDTELAAFIDTERESVRKTRFNTTARDVRAVRAAKKNIARALTERTRRMTAKI